MGKPLRVLDDEIEQRQRQVGQQVRTLRAERGLTLEDLAASSGCSIGSLSQIERGLGNPAFGTLVRIAHALGVPVVRLLHSPEPATVSPVVRKHERRRITPPTRGDGAVYELLTPDLDRALEVLHLRVPPGHDTHMTPFVHEGEEVCHLLRGTHEVNLNGIVYTLHEGDTISFPSTTPHWFRNVGKEEAELIHIITPPTW
jgi:transcriptional regulator with XRE-family HTH domain